jgi:hypothetical protein
MSSRRPPHSAEPHTPKSRDDRAVRPELRLEACTWQADCPALDAEDFAELRRSIRVVRRLIGGGLPLVKGRDAANDPGASVDPLDESATRFGVNAAFLRAGRPTPPLFLAWMHLCHQAAGNLLGDPDHDLYSYVDDPATDRERLIDLLDEVEARLDRLQGRS